MSMDYKSLANFWNGGLEEALCVDFDLQTGKLDALPEYIRKNDGWIHPVVGETILRLLDGVHPQHKLEWARSDKFNPKQMTLVETVARDFELAKEVARRGGFRRAHYAQVCKAVGDKSKSPLSGITVQRLVRPFRKSFAGSPAAQRSCKSRASE